MIFDLTIAAVAKELVANSLSIRQIANSRHTASFKIDSLDRSYRAQIDAEVIMLEDGVRVFGGLIDRTTETGMFRGEHPGIRTTINAIDFGAYTERRYVNDSFPAQSLEDRLQALITGYLTDYGVTLHASQVTGPTLPAVTYDYVRLDAVLSEQMKLTADFGQPFVYRIDYSKVLRAYQPSTVLAPFDLIGNVLPEVIGDIEVQPSNDGKANQVIVKVAPRRELGHVETFTGDGVTTIFQLLFTPDVVPGYVTDDVNALPSPINRTLTTTPFQGSADWTYHPANNTLERDLGPLPNGQVASITFDGTFSASYTATDPSWTSTPSSRRQKVLTLESIVNAASGQAFADAELAKSLEGPIFVKYHTWEQSIEPGQQQTITVSARALSGDAVIAEVLVTDKVHRLDRYVTAVIDDSQTNLDRTGDDVYRIWAGDKAGTGAAPTSLGTGNPPPVSPGPPFRAVQFNDSGAFAGDANFLYYKVENSLVCGGSGTAIDAPDHESCLAFGYNCQIDEP